MISLIIAGAAYIAATTQPTQWPDIDNHTLKGDAIVTSKVVCRDRWGTPMLPNAKDGYSLIAVIDENFIKESLIQPPGDPRGMVAYRPLPPIDAASETPILPAPPTVAPPQSAPAPASAAPVEAPLPDASAPAVAPSDAPAAAPTQ